MVIETNKEIGARIINIRKNILKMKQIDFAKLCGISRQLLCGIELGNNSLTLETLKNICIASGVSADYIIFNISNDNYTASYRGLRNKLSQYTDTEIKTALEILNHITNSGIL